jgi:manganese-dependent inorganic pyrophosphatase
VVIGHRNPDTDAICSAIAYAEFKAADRSPHAQAARCGDTNARIDYVWNRSGCQLRAFVADVSPKVRDVMAESRHFRPPDATMADALGVMEDKTSGAAVSCARGSTCAGLISVFKMTKVFFCQLPGACSIPPGSCAACGAWPGC